MDKGEKPLQLVDEKEEWLDVTIDGEVDNAIRYDDNSLDAFTSDGDGVVEDYLMEPRELDFGREKEELNEKLLKWQTINSMIWFC